jgi:hypothetical protein
MTSEILIVREAHRSQGTPISASLIAVALSFPPFGPSQSHVAANEIGDPDEKGGDQWFSDVASPRCH